MKNIFALVIAALTVLKVSADNPLVTHIYTADPTARVFNDTLYVYPSHDINEHDGLSGNNGFMMEDYHVYSSTDLMNYADHGVILDQKDVHWVDNSSYAMWAPDCNYYQGKYYFYFPGDFKVGVATSNHPTGPYTPVQNPIKNANGIDPNLFIDDDGTPYLYFGGGDNLKVMRMKSDMITPDMLPITVQTLPSEYKEGSFVFKKDGVYYFTFPLASDGSEHLAYATGNSPLGPFTYKGTFMDGWKDGCWTNHHSIVKYKAQWYLFYHHHDLTKDKSLRSMCADSLSFASNGDINKVIPTKRGIGVRKAYEKIQVDRFTASSGISEDRLINNEPAGFYVKEISNNDWLKYNNVDFQSKSYSSISARVNSSIAGGKIEIHSESSTGELIGEIEVGNTESEWKTINGELKTTPSGIKNLVLVFKGGNDASLFQVNWIRFNRPNTFNISFEGDGLGTVVINDTLSVKSISNNNLFSSAFELKSVEAKTNEGYEFVGWKINGVSVNEITNINSGDEVTANFNKIVVATDAFTRIEAETFSIQSGIQSEDCAEGGSNIGYIENDDYILFKNVNFGSGTNELTARVATQRSGGNISMHLDNISAPKTCDISFGTTGGWQKWESKTVNFDHISGKHDVFFKFGGGSGYLFNVNWFEFQPAPLAIPNKKVNDISIFPNPAQDVLNISGLESNARFKIIALNGAETESYNKQPINISLLPPGTYILQIMTKNEVANRLFNKIGN